MDFAIPDATRDFEREVRELLSSRETRRLIHEVHRREDGMDGDARELYRHLGRAGLLAPAWPVAYGGRDADYTAVLVLLEQLVQHGVPQSLYYISVQIVGSLILEAGTEEQRADLLPRLASGELSACILFTEPEHGSDLASVTTTATPDDGERRGWTIRGRKTYNLKSAYADLALCAVRTGAGASRYEGISLFLVGLDSPGVSVRPMPSLSDEQFHDITFDNVHVGPDALFGDVGAGWSLITRMFAAERNGLDYYVRGRYWLKLATDHLTRDGRLPTETDLTGLARHQARLDASRLLTCRALQSLQNRELRHRPGIAGQVALPARPPRASPGGRSTRSAWRCWRQSRPRDTVLESAYREAPGMTISGGASEVLLDVVTGARLLEDINSGG